MFWDGSDLGGWLVTSRPQCEDDDVYDDGDQKIQGKQGNDDYDQNNDSDDGDNSDSDDDGSQPRRLTGRLSIPISRRNVSESGHLLEWWCW